MQKEIDHLKRSLCHEHRKQAPSNSDYSSDDEKDEDYKQRSRTPPSESFSYDEDYRHERKNNNSSSRGLVNDAMSKALNRISKSFTLYNGRTDPIEHISHFNQKMVVHSKNETLMCKVFPSSLRPVAIRWFDSLKAGSIDSFKELTQTFGSRFIMCSRAPRLLASLLSLSMREGETLKTYSDRYWEMFNEIEGDFEDMAISTFKLGLSAKHGLRKSLTGKPVTSVRQLMDQIDNYKRVEEDQQQDKGKGKVIPQERRDFKSDRYNNNKPWRDFAGQSRPATSQLVNTVFREPMHQVLEKIKNEPYFKWPNKMSGEQLVKEGRLQQFPYQPNGQGDQSRSRAQGNVPSRPPLGTINIIFTAPRRTSSYPAKVMSVASSPDEDANPEPKRSRLEIRASLSFSDEDKIGTIQPHDDASVVTLRIGGYNVKRVTVDQGSCVEVMYPDLYKRLNLRPEDLTAYDSPLVSFDAKLVTPKGQIRLPIEAGSEVMEVDFIVVDAYSPYTALVAKPWLHTLGVVASTLHQKVKYPSGDRIEELVRNQPMAK
ncbi:uncharacterized protein LOC115984567 [Quercus lobata]|uniref:uncharacterized protein LOC115984567 n=1 Tax=Quercus lobata TaxID=97700 RepID=UPI001245CB8A|nr:uncharacterized protein LOC115984567 [Quercus lobata]